MPHKLLLADDSVTIQRVIELTFADEEIQVLAVGDGKQAIASIQSERPDIVLADVGMPERDGYEVASFIKTSQEHAHIPVLLLTGAFEPIDEARARAVGCDGVLVKPFEPQMVINRVKDLLAGRRQPGPWSAASAAPGAGTGAAGAATIGAGTTGTLNPASAASPAPGANPAGIPAGSLEDYFDRLDAAFASMEGPGGSAPEPPTGAPPVRSPLGTHEPQPASPQTGFQTIAPRVMEEAPRKESQPGGLPEAIAEWDPELTGDPQKPAPLEPRPIDLDPRRDFGSPSQGARPPAAAAPADAAGVAPPAPAPPAPSVPAPSVPAGFAHAAFAPGTGGPSAFAAAPAHAAPPQAAQGAAAAIPPPTLAEAFSALLSAEQGRPMATPAVPPLPDAAVEKIVQSVIARMADTAVRDTVVDVAERLVRDEIARIRNAR